jgi:phage-related minor tail protein
MADGKVTIIVDSDEEKAKKGLEDIEDAAEDAGQGLEKMGDGAKDAEKGLDAVDVAAGNLVSDGLSNLLGSLKDMAVEMVALADETREYREDMAKLNTAFKDGGSSTETAKSVYKDFYKILGESDRSIEAANHLAELTKNEKELSQWGTIAAGVTAKFGDSLPIEGLTEASNETAKVGKVTGPLADALNWAGISEDEFNKKLEKCNSEQERATLITSTLNKEYSAAAAEYNKLTASTQNARLATARMEEAQAAIGESIEPLTAAWTNMRAQAFEAMLPIIQSIVGAFQSISQWMTDNPEKAEIVKGVIIGLAAALGVLAVALGISNLISLVQKAFAMLNVTMLANPIVLIVAALAGLVAAFIYLWNNCEAFRTFWIDLWEWIKSACSSAWEAIKEWFSSAWEYVTGIWNDAKEYFAGAWDGIKEAFSTAKETLSKFFSDAWNGINEVFSKSTIR